jgi:CheY-like chemotaxis protein
MLVDPDRKSILVVEDEPFVRDDLVDFFEDRGFTVHAAGTADEAIRIMERHPRIFAVLTDIEMPGSMDGIRLAHYVRDRHPPTLLLLASGVVRPSAADLPEGALFFAKPFNPRAVLQQLCQA